MRSMCSMASPKSSLFVLRLMARTALSSDLSLDVFSRSCVASMESTYLRSSLCHLLAPPDPHRPNHIRWDIRIIPHSAARVYT